MRRRDFITLVGASAATTALPRIVLAQQRLPRIAFVYPVNWQPELIQACLQGLADYGYVDGRTITLETFPSPTDPAAMPAVLAQVVASQPDIILASVTDLALAARRATATIPIVFGISGDPVGYGVVASLAQPGGNATGNSLLTPDLVGKQLGLMKETMPTLKRLVALSIPAEIPNAPVMEQVRVAAESLNLELVVVDFVDGADFSTQFDRVVAASPQAVYVRTSAYFAANRDVLQDLQIKHKLPLFHPDAAGFPRAMVSYGANVAAVLRKTGSYVDAILRGAKPQDLPVAQPTVFDLGVNLTTAKALGITIPPTILAQATRIIE
jgi:putative ABC transport system substrate-binding protein